MLNIVLVSSKQATENLLKYTLACVVTTISLQEAKLQIYTATELYAAGSSQLFIPFTPMRHSEFCLLLMFLIKPGRKEHVHA